MKFDQWRQPINFTVPSCSWNVPCTVRNWSLASFFQCVYVGGCRWALASRSTHSNTRMGWVEAKVWSHFRKRLLHVFIVHRCKTKSGKLSQESKPVFRPVLDWERSTCGASSWQHTGTKGKMVRHSDFLACRKVVYKSRGLRAIFQLFGAAYMENPESAKPLAHVKWK